MVAASGIVQPAPKVVSRLVSQNSVGSIRSFPQAISGVTSAGQAYAPEAFTLSSTTGIVAEKAFAVGSTSAVVSPILENSQAPLWSRTPLGHNSVQPPTDEALHREVESLRQTFVMQETRIRELSQDLKASCESEARLSDELERTRAEVATLTAELKQERAAREQAEASLQLQSSPLNQSLTPTASAAGFTKRGAAATERGPAAIGKDTGATKEREVRSVSTSRRDKAELAEQRREAAEQRREAAQQRREAAAEAAAQRREAAAEQRRAAAEAVVAAQELAAQRPQSASAATVNSKRGAGTSRPASAKDEIDSRLQDFMARSQCGGIIFKRLNRGFYTFKRADEGPVSIERSLEMSIVNGKLMVRMEASTTDPGWNNGKPGPIERFVQKYGGS
mmetsp:Transcript_44151/g.101994  ORF Transcript_44151/g.101994 Transcript_44151/m.101994 type:complete len:393 (+) Transcript_44151:1-1179(+)